MNPEKPESHIQTPVKPSGLTYKDKPIPGGHQTAVSLRIAGTNNTVQEHFCVFTRIGNTVTLEQNVKSWASDGSFLGEENYTHAYSGSAAPEETQNPYQGLTDPNEIVTAVLKNKQLM